MWYYIIKGEISKNNFESKKAALIELLSKVGDLPPPTREEAGVYLYDKKYYIAYTKKVAEKYAEVKIEKPLSTKPSGMKIERNLADIPAEPELPTMPFEDELKQLMEKIKGVNNDEARHSLSGQWAKGVAEGQYEVANIVIKMMEKHGL